MKIKYWSSSMKDLIIDDFPDELYDELCRRAERNGRTVSDEALILLSATLQSEVTTADHQKQ
jgi:plasmid stability protein